MIYKSVGTQLANGAVLWRYFDFQKFLSFIIEKSLFFNRMDKMEDANEGISITQLQLKFGDTRERLIARIDQISSNKKELSLEKRQKLYFLSCWLIHHRESVAMWNSYSNDNGIAVKVDAKSLIRAATDNGEILKHSELLKNLYYGRVDYKDFFDKGQRKAFKDEIKIIGFQKDECFAHEKEFRFLIKQDIKDHSKHDIPFVKIQLTTFDAVPLTVVFHPKMEAWKKDNIKAVVTALSISNIQFKDSELRLKPW